MSIVEKVPWSCKEEWEYCRNQLFSDDVLMKKKAIQHLYIWKIRSSNLPAAVESTMILAEVYITETEWNEANSETITRTMSFESWYSMAIMRFLNLIMDSNVKAPTANTMNKLAKQFNIPEWIIEIRHIAAHGHSLPSLPSLREAAEFCLTWLFDNYWSKDTYQDMFTKDESDCQPFLIKCANICHVLCQYKSKGCPKLRDMNHSDKVTIIDVFSKMKENKSIEEIDNLALEDVYKMGLLKLSRHLQKSTRRTEDLIDYLLMEERNFICYEIENVNDARRRILEEWNDILSVICNSSGCWYLLKQLANIVTSAFEESWRRNCAALYINEILKTILFPKHLKNDLRKKLKRKLNLHENSETAIFNTTATLSDRELVNFLEFLVQDPNEYVSTIIEDLRSILDNYSRSMSFDKILELVNIYRGKSKMSVKGTNNCIYRVCDLSNYGHIMQAEELENVKSPVRSSESNESLWKRTPLGCLPWQNNFKPWLSMYLTND